MVNDFPSLNQSGLQILIVSEIVFFIDILLSFFKQDFDEEGKSKKEKLIVVASNYLNN